MIKRRRLLYGGAGALLGLALHARPGRAGAASFDFAEVIDRARALSRQNFQPPEAIPESWRALSYDQYRRIRFRPEQALWRGRGLFEIQLFHAGFFFDRPVAIHLIDGDGVRPLGYDPKLFDFAGLNPAEFGTGGPGYAGFRLHYPLNRSSHADEFAVFLGASYFRLIGRGQVYGLSARGLAVNTAHPDGEEFPLFREFWIERPHPEDSSLTLYALLDSPSVSGAYRFILRPRTATQADVHALLFPRKAIDKLGLAPLTSMYLYGEARDQARRFDDFRPEVHDSDGLQLHAGSGEWLWRPLVNRERLQLSSFYTENPRGFGLLQRDRDFASYQDLEADYHRRPSLWVQPLEDWGPGRIELVEIPSAEETNDNVVCYWVEERPVTAGAEIERRYLLNAYLDHEAWPPGGRAVATRIGSAHRPGAVSSSQPGRLFVIDFERGDLPMLSADQPLEAVINASSGRLGTPVVQKIPATGGWRVFFDFFPDGKAADLRCFLSIRRSVLTETWNYLWTPPL